MATLTARSLRSSRQWTCLNCRLTANLRFNSTDASPPPLLSKLKGDLKTAMKNKDTSRLSVLRAIISETNNASKTNSPIRTDLQLLALLKKRKAGAQQAVQEAKHANRNDLVGKQEDEIAVVDEYAGLVEVMGEQQVEEAVRGVLKDLGETKAGTVMKELFKAGGVLDGKPVDKAQVAKLVNRLLSG